MKGFTISVFALAAVLPLSAMAEDVVVLDDIIVTANRGATTKARTGASVSVILPLNLRRAAGRRITDVLARLPGVAVRTTGPMGTQAGLTIRGVPQTNILVRVDGIDVTDPTGTQVAFDFGRMGTADISRLELLRGAQSGLYGSRANGGVIDITTRRATEEGTTQEVAIEGGSYGTASLSYGLATKGDAGEVAFTLSHLRTDGYSAADEADGATEADGYEATRLSFAGSTELQNGVRLSLNGFYEDSWFEFDDQNLGLPFDGTPDDQEDRIQKAIRAAVDFEIGAVQNTIEASYFDSDRTLTGSTTYGDYTYLYQGARQTLAWRGHAELGASSTLSFGVERVRETYFDDTGYGSQSLKTGIDSVYAEYALAPRDDLDVVLSLRHDDHSQYGGFDTGRVSVNWRPTDDLTVRANLGNAYRAPSNYELYDVWSGNAALTPETSRNIDLGLEKTWGDSGRLAVTLFHVAAENLIDYSYTTYGYVQVDGVAKRSGVEVEGGWTLANGIDLTGTYTYTYATSSATLDSSSWLANTPRHMVALSVGGEVAKGLDAEVTLQAGLDRATLPDYAVVNLGLTKEIGEGREAYLRVENVFDTQYQTVRGYGTSDRAFYVGLRATF